LLPSIASLLAKKHSKPTFLYKKMVKESQGTYRGPKDLDSVALMRKCGKYALTYGGHAPASGFRVKNTNLTKFRKCLINNYK